MTDNIKNNDIFIANLYEEFSLKLKSRLINLVRCKDTTEDIMHDAFLRFSKLEKNSEISNPWGYLISISYNLIKDRAKANKVREKYCLNESHKEEDYVDNLSPERYLLSEEKFRTASRAIEKLPQKCKKVFIMHKVYNINHKEISETMGITHHAVEKHINRAKIKINEKINKYYQ